MDIAQAQVYARDLAALMARRQGQPRGQTLNPTERQAP